MFSMVRFGEALRALIFLPLLLNLCATDVFSTTTVSSQSIIDNSIGLIVLSKKFSDKDLIYIYNDDGSVWHKFTFYYAGKYPYDKDDFAPFSFYIDYFVLALKCTRKVGGRYEVIVNEESGLKKYVLLNNASLSYESWNAHILRLFGVGFDAKKNPMRQAKQGAIKKVTITKDDGFRPVKIIGDWLLVERDISGEGKAFDFGWIRWKENKRLLIELYYVA